MRGNRNESSYVSSQFLQQFTKDTYQSQYAYPLHSYHSSSKIQSSKYINNQSLSIPNRTMISQTSRKKLQTSKNEYQDHFQQIQKILMNENSNLKQQNEYLADEIRRITKKQKYLKQQLEEITFRSHQQNNYIAKLQTEFSQLKDFVEENVRALIVLLQTNSINNIKNTLSQFIEGASDIINLDIVENVNFKEVEQRQSINTADQQIQKEIEKLSVRLQSLIKQNNSSCREPAVRRECIEIARQIKQLQNRKITPRFSKQNSETYHEKHKRSKTKNVVKNYSIREKTSRLSLKEHSMAKKQQSEDNFKYPRQIYSKVTYRRSGSKQKRLRDADSMSSMFNRGEQR